MQNEKNNAENMPWIKEDDRFPRPGQDGFDGFAGFTSDHVEVIREETIEKTAAEVATRIIHELMTKGGMETDKDFLRAVKIVAAEVIGY